MTIIVRGSTGDAENPARALESRPSDRSPDTTSNARLPGPAGRLKVSCMSPLQARVETGRLVLDQPTTLPEGTVIDPVADDEGDDLTDAERRTLHEALSSAVRSADAGRLRPASEILDELRRQR